VRRWLERRSSRPYFLFVNYFDAHDPYLSPTSLEAAARRISNKRWRDLLATAGSPGHVPLSEPERSALIQSYDTSLTFLDEQVGDLLRLIRHSSSGQRTVFILTADHGEGFGEHATYSHGWNLYREVLHVPLIVAGPGIPKGMRVNSLVGTRDLFDTTLDLAAGQGAKGHSVDTGSLARYWTSFDSRPTSADQIVVSELVPIYGDQDRTAQISLTNASWHYIRQSDGVQELYHWTEDPGEKYNLAHSPSARPIAESLALLLYRRVLTSRQPWRGGLYLSALDSSGLLSRGAVTPTGKSGPARSPGEPAPGDKDLIESIPYH
jgi:arylsulfatase A-like enzyme